MLQAMENPQRGTDDCTDKRFSVVKGKSRRGGPTLPKTQLIIVCLTLLNAALLTVAVAIGINCAKVKHGALHTPHLAATKLINELNYLRSNHSDVIEAEEEVKKALERAVKDHEGLKVQIQQLATMNDGFQRQLVTMRTEKRTLQSNISALAGTCGKCPSKWVHLNSSCYFFSSTETDAVKKNWPDSRADCIGRGADLVVIDSPEEQTYVSETIRTLKGLRGKWENGFWIGLTDMEVKKTWVWVNNVTELEQRYWIYAEPNISGNGRHGQDCVVAVYEDSNPWKTWFYERCTESYFDWICETPSA
ncbi:hypothetical protein INR49_032567 [Caranx melampygus]|nr:hypothetical protein INR49_032567 [Caranx melampygus]